jgi:hypothetical protein
MYIRSSLDGQAPLLWVIFAVVDFPISLIYFLAGQGYSRWLHALDNPILAQVFYLPHFIHGVLGTLWWYWLPKIISRFRTTRKAES